MKLFNTRSDMVKELVNQGSRCAEIGVFEGEFSFQIEKIVQPSQLYMIDLFTGRCDSGNQDGNNVVHRDMESVYKSLLSLTSDNQRIKLMKGRSTDMLATFHDDSLDMVYIDGDHSYTGCIQDLEIAYKKVHSGGWIMGHDYEMNMVKARTRYDFGVKQAVDEFCQKRNQTIYAKALDGCVSFAIQLNK